MYNYVRVKNDTWGWYYVQVKHLIFWKTVLETRDRKKAAEEAIRLFQRTI